MAPLPPILQGKYPAKAHARRVAEYLKSHGHIAPSSPALIYLEAQKTKLIEDNDEPVPFRQRRPFYYLSGCPLADAYLTYAIPTDTLTLFIPPIDPDSVIWSGLPVSPEEALKLYDVDDVKPATEVNVSLAHTASALNDATVFAIADQISPHTTFLSFSATNFSALKPAIESSRAVKSPYEVALLKHANAISTLAHTAVLRAVRTAKNERELEAVFYSTCIRNGAREQSYHPIVAGGTNAATLHYTPNDAPLSSPSTLNLLLDAGGEYNCYCADITRTFPVSGSFTPESRAIYDIVLDMQMSCLALLKKGVRWDDVHEHAHKVAITGLLKLGILKGGAEEILEKRVSVAFFPHGLGHYLGMDTHDTGGNPDYADKDSMFRHLRVRGELPAGAVITVEPGIYFCPFIIDPFLENAQLSKFIDKDVLGKYWSVGGVRIEDNILITDDGYENLTTAIKDVDEMERVIKEG